MFHDLPPHGVMFKVFQGQRPHRPPVVGSSARLFEMVWGLAIHCWSQQGEDRPTMGYVMTYLGEVRAMSTVLHSTTSSAAKRPSAITAISHRIGCDECGEARTGGSVQSPSRY
jgi:hypothetical protein